MAKMMTFSLVAGILLISAIQCHSSSSLLNPAGKLAARSCSMENGVLCYPTACSNTSCLVTNETVCIDDRCGCEARIFKKQGSTWKEVTNVCKVFNNIKNLLNFSQDENAKSPKAPVVSKAPSRDRLLKDSLTIFKDFNRLLSELLGDLGRFIRERAEVEPTRAVLNRLKIARNGIRALIRSRRVLEAVGDEDFLADEDSSNAGELLAAAVKTMDKVAKLVTNSTGVFKNEIKSGKVLASDIGIVPFTNMLHGGVMRGVSNLFSSFQPFAAQAAYPYGGFGAGLARPMSPGFGMNMNVLPVLPTLPVLPAPAPIPLPQPLQPVVQAVPVQVQQIPVLTLTPTQVQQPTDGNTSGGDNNSLTTIEVELESSTKPIRRNPSRGRSSDRLV